MKIVEKEFNALTGEETISEREETALELEKRLEVEAKFAQRQAEAEALAEAKAIAQAKLAALGLTVEDLQALGL
jgi:hypothetical protein